MKEQCSTRYKRKLHYLKENWKNKNTINNEQEIRLHILSYNFISKIFIMFLRVKQMLCFYFVFLCDWNVNYFQNINLVFSYTAFKFSGNNILHEAKYIIHIRIFILWFHEKN